MADADLRFLEGDASDEVLLAACADNHLDWMRRLARAAGGTVSHDDGIDWIHTSHPVGEVIVALTNPPDDRMRQHVEDILAFCRANDVQRVSYWAFSDAYSPDLGPCLGARGFRWGGRPHWIAADLWADPAPPTVVELPGGVVVTTPDTFTDQPSADLPCFQPGTAEVFEAMVAERPQRVWHPVGWQDGRPIGQVSLNLTTGDLGVCGLNDALVLPSGRVRGPGIVRFDWLRRFVLDLGCRYLVANAAADAASLYRMMGFRSLGFGQTWWLSQHGLAEPPSPVRIAFAEAVGRGDLAELEALTTTPSGTDLDEQLANGMTPLQFAAVTARRDSAEWLVDKGATLDVLAAWDLGWKDEADRLLQARPELATARRPRSGKTLLHVAVERNDAELTALLLNAGADPTARDHRFDSTPLEWASELRRPRVAMVIRSHPRGGG